MKFVKMHGLGNDYIFLNCMESIPADLPGLSRKLSHRHFGVGSDGLICICPSERADFRMRMFNADGSEGAMCGNGIRCVGKYVYDRGLTGKRNLEIETLSGLRRLELDVRDRKVVSVTVDMGRPNIGQILKISVNGIGFTGIEISMGNPHFVIQSESIEGLNLGDIGPALESHPRFKEEVNVEFVHVLSRKRLAMRVWERGSGETMACGTGACAAVAAMKHLGLVDRQVSVRLPGGILKVDWRENGLIYLTGPAVTVFKGEVEPEV